jgi:hypothetical protein
MWVRPLAGSPVGQLTDKRANGSTGQQAKPVLFFIQPLHDLVIIGEHGVGHETAHIVPVSAHNDLLINRYPNRIFIPDVLQPLVYFLAFRRLNVFDWRLAGSTFLMPASHNLSISSFFRAMNLP